MFFFHDYQDAHATSFLHQEGRIHRPMVIAGLTVSFPKRLASIVKVPPSKPPVTAEGAFKDLECTNEDVQKITRLISVMGENGKLTLLLKYQKELRQIGREIEHVHPLKFLSVILTNPHLKSCMREVHSDYFKWTNFLDGIGNGLSSQHKQGKVSVYLNDFAQTVGVSVESLQPYVQSHDWENMLVYLINH